MTSAPWRPAPPWSPPQPRRPGTGAVGRSPGSTGDRAAAAWRRLRRTARRARRPVAALLLASATALVVHAAVRPPAVSGAATVVVATRDLPAGASPASGTQVVRLPAEAVPEGALTPSSPALADGSRLAAPVRRGEVLTDVRLTGAAGLLASLGPGEVALPVPVASPLPEGLVSPGQRVAVLAGEASGGWAADGVAPPEPLVGSALVLAVNRDPVASGLLTRSGGSTAVVLALAQDDAARVASAAAGGGVVLAVTG
ncbi:RcpC/CpaB family pilus assembly protein [Quadrisphaera sp. INWT6]|uniref:RcpC/CpaB family pilus assembly protein n=1 Tax=Quadrisphaera sp. INWT6 TaxID=2596917 RepID=UPI0018920D4F|nr:RcpC/CpaB family pilus assembly protein [Quadrisphaera sp. INWT6]MBF5080247.1 Flp pilus assembly protein CpaB [Quadrisphaera sp. INWT6]